MYPETKVGLYRSKTDPKFSKMVLEASEPLEDEDGFHLVIIADGSFSLEITSEDWKQLVDEHQLEFARVLTKLEKETYGSDDGLVFF